MNLFGDCCFEATLGGNSRLELHKTKKSLITDKIQVHKE